MQDQEELEELSISLFEAGEELKQREISDKRPITMTSAAMQVLGYLVYDHSRGNYELEELFCSFLEDFAVEIAARNAKLVKFDELLGDDVDLD